MPKSNPTLLPMSTFTLSPHWHNYSASTGSRIQSPRILVAFPQIVLPPDICSKSGHHPSIPARSRVTSQGLIPVHWLPLPGPDAALLFCCWLCTRPWPYSPQSHGDGLDSFRTCKWGTKLALARRSRILSPNLGFLLLVVPSPCNIRGSGDGGIP